VKEVVHFCHLLHYELKALISHCIKKLEEHYNIDKQENYVEKEYDSFVTRQTF